MYVPSRPVPPPPWRAVGSAVSLSMPLPVTMETTETPVLKSLTKEAVTQPWQSSPLLNHANVDKLLLLLLLLLLCSSCKLINWTDWNKLNYCARTERSALSTLYLPDIQGNGVSQKWSGTGYLDNMAKAFGFPYGFPDVWRKLRDTINKETDWSQTHANNSKTKILVDFSFLQGTNIVFTFVRHYYQSSRYTASRRDGMCFDLSARQEISSSPKYLGRLSGPTILLFNG
jgi:hypothetical protein